MLKLRGIRKAAGMTMKELGAKVGVTESAIGLYETGKREPNYEMLLRLSEALGCQVSDIMGHTTQQAVEHISEIDIKYNALDPHGKKIVKTILGMEYARCIGAKPKPVTKVIPLFSQAFAAGGNDSFAEDAWEDYEVPEDTKADFAIRVSGDSMEPELHDGEIYLCKRRYPEIGEICVAMVNGGFYVKQFVTDGHNIYLLSVNRARKDSDIDIMETGQYTGKCLGTVIHKRIPLVEP